MREREITAQDLLQVLHSPSALIRVISGKIRSSVSHLRRILFSEHDFSSQGARSSKEVTEADAFLCELYLSLCALCFSIPLLWLQLRRARSSAASCKTNSGLVGVAPRQMFRGLTKIRLPAAVGLLLAIAIAHAGPARWFMPGALGYEPGSAPPPPAADAFLTRAMQIDRTGEEKVWSEKNLLTPRLEFSHNLATIVRKEDYAAHPEWFPLVGGQRYRPPEQVVNWNPDLASEAVVQRAAEIASAAFQADPRRESFSLGVNDALIFGESPEMLPWITPPHYFRSRPNYSDLVFQFNNRVAEQVSRSFPDRYLGVLAYYWCEDVPTIRVHPQIVPFLTADRSQGYDRRWWQEETRLQLAWAAKGTRRLGLYDYLDGAGFLVPRLHMRLIAEYLPRARSLGFTDYYGESSPNWGLDGPQQWLVAQLIAQPGASAPSLLEEYYTRFYGEAAVPMRQFFERCEDLWMAQPPPADWLKHYRSETQALLFPSGECVRLRTLLEQARALAKSEKVRQRVEFVSAAFGATERFVAFCEAKAEVSRLTTDDRRRTTEDGESENLEKLKADTLKGRTAEGGRRRADDRGQRADVGSETNVERRTLNPQPSTSDEGVTAGRTLQSEVQNPELKTQNPKPKTASNARALFAALERYLRAKTEFVDYMKRLEQTQPLAIYSGKLDDFLCMDPAYDAALTALESGVDEVVINRLGDPAVDDALQCWRQRLGGITTARLDSKSGKLTGGTPMSPRPETESSETKDLATASSPERLSSPSFEGGVTHGLRIAGLQYRADITAGWNSRVEPAEDVVAAVTAAAARTGSAGLRLANNKYASVFAWSPRPQARGFEVAAYLRGQLSSSARVMLTISWLDASQRLIGIRRVRFIPTSTSEWTRLRVGQATPANAVWVGACITAAYQLPGDWVDVDDASLKPWEMN